MWLLAILAFTEHVQTVATQENPVKFFADLGHRDLTIGQELSAQPSLAIAAAPTAMSSSTSTSSTSTTTTTTLKSPKALAERLNEETAVEEAGADPEFADSKVNFRSKVCKRDYR